MRHIKRTLQHIIIALAHFVISYCLLTQKYGPTQAVTASTTSSTKTRNLSAHFSRTKCRTLAIYQCACFVSLLSEKSHAPTHISTCIHTYIQAHAHACKSASTRAPTTGNQLSYLHKAKKRKIALPLAVSFLIRITTLYLPPCFGAHTHPTLRLKSEAYLHPPSWLSEATRRQSQPASSLTNSSALAGAGQAIVSRLLSRSVS